MGLGCKPTGEAKTGNSSSSGHNEENKLYKISLAQWSFHNALQSGRMTHLDFIRKAGNLNFEGVEYVNRFFFDKALNKGFLQEMNTIAQGEGLNQLLIMVDDEGHLADTDPVRRARAIFNHKKWVEAAAELDCHSIRVNCSGEGASSEVALSGIQGLGELAYFAMDYDINILVENHGGYSSDAQWLNNVMAGVNLANCGTLPDFDNFCIEEDSDGQCLKSYDRYKGVKELLPLAKAVSAKSYAFDKDGNETTIDFFRMMRIIKDSSYDGFIGVEFEGDMDEEKGVLATRDLLLKAMKAT